MTYVITGRWQVIQPLAPLHSQATGGGRKFQLSQLVPLATSPHPVVTKGLSKNRPIDINSGVVERGLLSITKDIFFIIIYLELFQDWEQK